MAIVSSLPVVATLPLWWSGYLLLVYPPSPVEYAAGAAVAVLATGCTAVAATVAGQRWRRPPGIVRTVAGLPWQLLRGYLRVITTGLAPRRGPVRGRLRHESAAGIGRPGPDGAGRRAWIGWARSLAADELVVGFSGDDTIVVHVLPAPSGEAR
ncbi:MAG: hypothetical protein ABR528_05490 [Pseudonocardiaceae bacterium]